MRNGQPRESGQLGNASGPNYAHPLHHAVLALILIPLILPLPASSCHRYGFVVYQDPAVTDIAIAGLNGLKMGDRTLTVRRAAEVSGKGSGQGAGGGW